jgi:hypothetical protein
VVPSSTVHSVRKGPSLCVGGQRASPVICRDYHGCALSVQSLDRGAGMCMCVYMKCMYVWYLRALCTRFVRASAKGSAGFSSDAQKLS